MECYICQYAVNRDILERLTMWTSLLNVALYVQNAYRFSDRVQISLLMNIGESDIVKPQPRMCRLTAAD